MRGHLEQLRRFVIVELEQVGKVGKRSAPPLQRQRMCDQFSKKLSLLFDRVDALRWSGGALRLPTFPTCSLLLITRVPIGSNSIGQLKLLLLVILFGLIANNQNVTAQTIRVSPSDINGYSQGPTSALLTFGGLVNKQPAEATWCGRLISAAPDIGMKCDPSNVFGVLPRRYDQSQLLNTTFTDVMSVTPQVARRAYLDAVAGSTSTYFYVRRFASTNGGPSEYVPVTIRLSGNGARVPLSLTEVKLTWGVGTPVLFVRTGEKLPRVLAEITYTGTGRLKGRWELVKPGETPPEPHDLLTEATLPVEERGTQRRYQEIDRFNIYLAPNGKINLPGPDVSRVDESLTGLYLLLLRIEASDEKESESDLSTAGAGNGIVYGGAVAGFSLPTLRYYVSDAAQPSTTISSSQFLQISPKDAEEVNAVAPMAFSWSGVEQAATYRLEISDLQDAPILSAIVVGPTMNYQAPSWIKDKIGNSVVRWHVSAFDQERKLIAETSWRYLRVAH